MSASVVEQTDGRLAQSRDGFWNFLTFGGDIAFFTLALNIASVYTIAPLFASHLGANNTIIALIPAIRALGVFAPQLLIAAHVERKRRVKPLILGITIGERVPALIIGVATLALAVDHPAATLVLFLIMTLVPAVSSGLTFPAWYDLIGRAIPHSWLGRFLGFWMGVGGGLGALGALGAAALINAFVFPLNFALCFLLAFLAYVVSFILLVMGREPARARAVDAASEEQKAEATASASRPAGSDLNGYLTLLREDPPFGRYLVANAVSGLATMAGALFAVAAAKQGHLSDAEVGIEGVVLAIAMTAGNFLWGVVGDHVSHRATLIWSGVCAGLSAIVALGAFGVWWYGVAFFLLGLSISATQLAQLTATAEFGPIERRPSYIAITGVAYAPFGIFAPLMGGWMADHWGYQIVFALSAALGILSAVAYVKWGPRRNHHKHNTSMQASVSGL